MNIQIPWANKPLSLPLTAGCQIPTLKSPRSLIKQGPIIEQITLDRYYIVPVDPVHTYSQARREVTVTENIIGSEINIYV